MSGLRYLTAGESHGAGLTAVVEGCPAGIALEAAFIDADLRRRQGGYGRGDRQTIEQDAVRILGGVRYGRTTGAPVALFVANRDAANWGDILAVEAPVAGESGEDPVIIPRPGHADLGGALLYGLDDIRDVIERASARETAAKVACGAVAKRILAALGCVVASHVVAIGAEKAGASMTLDDVEKVEADPVRCLDAEAGRRMMAAIDAASAAGDTLGGVVEVLAFGYPPGVGTYVQGDRRLQARLAGAVLSVPAIKGVEFGLGFEAATLPGQPRPRPAGVRRGARLHALRQPRRRYRGRHLDGGDDRAPRGDEADLDAAGTAGQRRARHAPRGGIEIRALGRVRRARRRGGARGGRRHRSGGRGAGPLRRRDGGRARRRGGGLPAPHPGALTPP